MCVDPIQSSRRQRRLDLKKKGKSKQHRPWHRTFFIKGLTDTRRRRLERLHQAEEIFELIVDHAAEAEPFASEMIAEEDLAATRWLKRREDAEATSGWLERNPYVTPGFAA